MVSASSNQFWGGGGGNYLLDCYECYNTIMCKKRTSWAVAVHRIIAARTSHAPLGALPAWAAWFEHKRNYCRVGFHFYERTVNCMNCIRGKVLFDRGWLMRQFKSFVYARVEWRNQNHTNKGYANLNKPWVRCGHRFFRYYKYVCTVSCAG